MISFRWLAFEIKKSYIFLMNHNSIFNNNTDDLLVIDKLLALNKK
jgi:hypothetical protein